MLKCKPDTIVTIGRTFGSGGREIGKKVAEQLGIPFYDKELLEVAAKESGGVFSPGYLSEYDEKKMSGFLYLLAFGAYTSGSEPLDVMAQSVLTKAIHYVAEKGPCVIIGRRADKILRDKDILSVFICASMDKRIVRVLRRDGLSGEDSKSKILKADRNRRAYYNSYDEGEWGEASNYNLCIDSGDLGIDNSAALILHYLKLRGKLA